MTEAFAFIQDCDRIYVTLKEKLLITKSNNNNMTSQVVIVNSTTAANNNYNIIGSQS